MGYGFACCLEDAKDLMIGELERLHDPEELVSDVVIVCELTGFLVADSPVFSVWMLR